MSADMPEDRWKLLSAAVAGFRSRGWDFRKDAAFFAMTVARELQQFIGAPQSFPELMGTPSSKSIKFFSYVPGNAPAYDRFEEVDSAMNAIGSDAGFATFGLGVTLEISPTTLPRHSIHWLMRINTVHPRTWICEVRMTRIQRFELSVTDGQVDVSTIVMACFDGVLRWLESANRSQQPSQQIGFDISKN